MIRQELKDAIYKSHEALLKQGMPSRRDYYETGMGPYRQCMYRQGKNKCAIGHIIKDEYYDPSFEGSDVRAVLNAIAESLGLHSLSNNEILTLIEFQECHDDAAELLSPEEFLRNYKGNFAKFECGWLEEKYTQV